jgi:hypothetical protein
MAALCVAALFPPRWAPEPWRRRTRHLRHRVRRGHYHHHDVPVEPPVAPDPFDLPDDLDPFDLRPEDLDLSDLLQDQPRRSVPFELPEQLDTSDLLPDRDELAPFDLPEHLDTSELLGDGAGDQNGHRPADRWTGPRGQVDDKAS